MNIESAAEMEQAFCAALLLDNRFLPLLGRLEPVDFVSADAQTVFVAMRELVASRTPVDALTIIKKLPNFFDKIDKWLCAPALVPVNAESYFTSIIEASRKRQLAALASSIKTSTDSGTAVADILAEARAGLDKITAGVQEKSQFPVLTWSVLQNYEPPSGYTLAGTGWLRRHAGCLLTGGTGVGKSVLMEQICVAMAAGANILGCIDVHAPCRVLLVEAENDEETLKRDLSAIIKHTISPTSLQLVDDNLRIIHAYGLHDVDLAKLLLAEGKKHKIDLLAIDPYQAFLPPYSDINKTDCFMSFIRPIQAVMQELNAGLILAAHTPKPKDRENWTARESVYLAAGSSAMANWARTSCELTQVGEDDGRFRLRFGKNAERNGLTTEKCGIVRDLYIEHSGRISEPYWRVSDVQTPPLSAKAMEIIQLATENPKMKYAEIAEKLGCSKSLVAKHYPK